MRFFRRPRYALLIAFSITPALVEQPAQSARSKHVNSEVLPSIRLKELRRCEEYLLRAMPLVPLLFYGYAGFQKSYVRGLGTNFFDVHPFKYTWIDTNWRPS